MTQTVSQIEQFIQSGRPHLVVTLGTEMVMDAKRDSKFRTLINQAPLVLPDGGGLLWAAKRMGTPLKERVAGIDLLLSICEKAQTQKWRIFFLGGKPGIAELARQNVRFKFPGAQIVGTHHGYFDQTEVIEILQRVRPDILFVGLGFPHQEYWIENNLEALKIPVGVGVGGSFDVLAGKLKRAPTWMMRLNLEWLFRFFQQPQRLKRILKIPLFMAYIYVERIRRPMTRGDKR